jgi:hypothetical protein
MRFFTLILAVTFIVGCGSNSVGPSGPVSAQVVLAPGESSRIKGTTLQLRFRGVLNDSRCPADVLCVLGGDALVRIDVQSDRGGKGVYDLHTGDMKPVQHAELTIALVELSPYPFSARPIAPGDYRATFRITR